MTSYFSLGLFRTLHYEIYGYKMLEEKTVNLESIHIVVV